MTSHSLADWISGLRFEDIPQRVRSRAKLAVFDACGAALAGTHHPAAQQVREQIANTGSAPQIRIMGDPSLRAGQLDGAWLLATMGEAYLYSSIHVPSGGQFTSALLAAILAVSEVREIGGPQALTAYAAGYEVAARLAMAVDSESRRWDVTAVAGAMGAAAAAGRVLGLSPGQLRHALTLAAGEASGGDDSATPGGRAARGGLAAALQAARGPVGREMRAGEELTAWLEAFGSESSHADSTLSHWGNEFSLDRAELHFRLYPTPLAAHGFIDAALALHQRDVAPEMVRRIVCRVSPSSPPALSFSPASPQQAQHSLPYAVAAALCDGRVGLAQFNASRISDDQIQSLTGRVEVEQDPSAETPEGRHFPALLRAELTDGRSVVESVEHARGSPQRPPTRPEFEGKFRQCAGAALSTERTLLAARCLYQLDTLQDMRTLVDALSLAPRS